MLNACHSFSSLLNIHDMISNFSLYLFYDSFVLFCFYKYIAMKCYLCTFLFMQNKYAPIITEMQKNSDDSLWITASILFIIYFYVQNYNYENRKVMYVNIQDNTFYLFHMCLFQNGLAVIKKNCNRKLFPAHQYIMKNK